MVFEEKHSTNNVYLSVSEEYRRFTGSRGGRILVELLIEVSINSRIHMKLKDTNEFLGL